MSDERVYKRMQEEIAEAERNRLQAQIDRFWWEKRAALAEERRLKKSLDPYGLGLYD